MKTIEIKDRDLLEDEIIKKGFSQRSIASVLKYSQSLVSLVLQGKRNPSPEFAKSLCKVINCKFDKFFLIINNYKSN